PTDTYTPSLHDALPICRPWQAVAQGPTRQCSGCSRQALQIGPHDVGHAAQLCETPQVFHSGASFAPGLAQRLQRDVQADLVAILDRKSTRLNSSHVKIS